MNWRLLPLCIVDSEALNLSKEQIVQIANGKGWHPNQFSQLRNQSMSKGVGTNPIGNAVKSTCCQKLSYTISYRLSVELLKVYGAMILLN